MKRAVRCTGSIEQLLVSTINRAIPHALICNLDHDVCQTPPRTPHSAVSTPVCKHACALADGTLVSSKVSGQRRKRALSKFKSPLIVSKRLKTAEPSTPVSTARSEDSEELERLMTEKKDLLARLHEGEEKLRKLKLVRTHHSKVSGC